jgi:photosystem II stability/assembly factor-like uncharacterized protein
MLGLGTAMTLWLAETPSLALADLSDAPVRVVTTNAAGEVLYAVLNGQPQLDGLYRSHDAGQSWQFIGPGPAADINALITHPTNESVLFAGSPGGPVTTTNNLWRSDDAGQSWYRFFLSLPAHPDGLIPAVTTLAIDPDQPHVLYVGTDGQGVYRFDVGPNGHGYSLVGGVLFHNMRIKRLVVGADSQIYALTDKALFVTNNGDTWHELALPPELPYDLVIAAGNPYPLYSIASSGAVYRSIDKGQSWLQVGGDWWTIPDATLQGTALTINKQDANHVAISTAYQVNDRLVGGSIYETRDAGQNWIKVADANGVVTQLAIDNNVIYAAAPEGLVRYREPAQSNVWQPLTDLVALLHLNGAQILVLLLTMGLAGLILWGRTEWLLKLWA